MLYVLLALVLFLTVAAYFLFNRDIMAPPFILSALFSVSCICAIIGNRDWKVDVSYEAVAALFLGLFSIFVGGLFAEAIGQSRRRTKGNPLPERNGYLTISNLKLLILLAVDIVILFLYYKRLIEMATAIGYKGTGFLYYVRIATINNGTKLGTFFTVTLGFIGANSNVALFTLINNYFHRKQKNRGAKTSVLLCFALIVTSLVVKALSGARNGFIAFFVYLVAYFVFCSSKKGKINLSKILPLAFGCIFAFFIIFTVLGNMTGKTGDSAIDKIVLYTGSSIVGFSVWLRGFSSSHLFGQESFWGLRYLLNKFFPNVKVTSHFLQGVRFPNGDSTNIFTGFRSYIADFGTFGLILIPFLIGFVMTFAYVKVKKKRSPLAVILFSYFLYHYIYILFTPSITSELFTSSQIFGGFFWNIVAVWFAIGRSPKRGKLRASADAPR